MCPVRGRKHTGRGSVRSSDSRTRLQRKRKHRSVHPETGGTRKARWPLQEPDVPPGGWGSASLRGSCPPPPEFQLSLAPLASLLQHLARLVLWLGRLPPPKSSLLSLQTQEKSQPLRRLRCTVPLTQHCLQSFFFCFFNWSRVELQHYVIFRCTVQWFSMFTDYTPSTVITRSCNNSPLWYQLACSLYLWVCFIH